MFDYLKKMIDLSLVGDIQGIFFWIVFYITLACLVSLFFQLQVRSWPSTTGKLIKLEVGGSGTELAVHQRDHFLEAEYHYSIDGEHYSGSRISMTTIWTLGGFKYLLLKQLAAVEKLPNGNVKLYYNPKAPKKSYLIKPSTMSYILTIMPSVFFLFICINIFNGRHRKDGLRT